MLTVQREGNHEGEVMKMTARFWPGPIVFVLYLPMYVYSMLLVGFGAPASGGVWWLIAMLGAAIAVLSIQSWASYLEVDVDKWLLRGLLRERAIPTTLVRGIRVERFVDVVAVGGIPPLDSMGCGQAEAIPSTGVGRAALRGERHRHFVRHID